ncbi:MAG TPA: single-stranded-DNA-specific exonuclease RecJ [Chloroflexia bacterium]|nr:single-stranded-DNA-specific exonuclease RecJ [Chloroflexia bacterium]
MAHNPLNPLAVTTGQPVKRVQRVWEIRPTAPDSFLTAIENAGYSRLVGQLLYNREVTTPEQIEYFFKADYRNLADPFLIKDMDKAVMRIKAALSAEETIAIYGDFDADGVTACSLLMQFFKALGANVIPRIPHRVDEGYGLNPSALGRLGEQGVTLVITVDCGISNFQEVAFAAKLGIDIIITDHHRPPEILPAACAILNVRQPGDDYPYKGMAGVGVAFHLVRALTQAGVKPAGNILRPSDLLDLVALGTVADIAPMTGENRVLVAAGLKAINRTARPGIVALIEAAGLKQGSLDTSSIGFSLAPRINAAGRIDDAIIAYELLLTEDLERARELASELSTKNKERQQRLSEVLGEARARVYAGNLHELHKLMVLSGQEWPAGIVGLVAGRLCEEFNRPVLVLEEGAETSKGSARSTPYFNIIEALSECNDLLLRYGGHKQAAGFTVETARLPEFTQRLQALAIERLSEAMLVPQLYIDAELSLEQLPVAFRESNRLVPFGSENPAPVFVTKNLLVREMRPVGVDGAHLRLRLFDRHNGRIAEAIGFREGARAAELAGAKFVDIAYTIELNEWQGNRSLQLRLCDLRPSQ